MGLLSALGLKLPGLGLQNPFSDLLGANDVASGVQAATQQNPFENLLGQLFHPAGGEQTGAGGPPAVSPPPPSLTSMTPGTTAKAYDPSGLPPLDPKDPMAPAPEVKSPAMFVPPVPHAASGGIPDTYYASIRSAESGGNDAAKNPTSSATGRYQFLGSTWGQVAAAHPELGLTANGRNDPAQQERAIRAFTQDNANQLQAAGIPITGGSLYAAHFLGVGGAKQAYRNSDNTPMPDVVGPGVVSANGFLRGMTVGQFKQWAEKKGGGGSGTPTYGPTSDAMSRPSGSQWTPAGGTSGSTFAPGTDTNTALNTPRAGRKGGGGSYGSGGGSEGEQARGGSTKHNALSLDYKRYQARKSTDHLRALSPVATIQALADIGKGLQAESTMAKKRTT